MDRVYNNKTHVGSLGQCCSPQKRADELEELGAGHELLVEEGDAAEKVLIDLLALQDPAHLQEEQYRRPCRLGTIWLPPGLDTTRHTTSPTQVCPKVTGSGLRGSAFLAAVCSSNSAGHLAGSGWEPQRDPCFRKVTQLGSSRRVSSNLVPTLSSAISCPRPAICSTMAYSPFHGESWC